MTLQERPRATDTAHSTEAIKARIDQWCELFDLTPPKGFIRNGKVYLNQNLTHWIASAGASFDWIILGDVKAMCRAYRRECQTEAQLAELVEERARTASTGENPDPVAQSIVQRLDDQELMLTFFRTLTQDEKSEFMARLKEGTSESLRAFEAYYRQSRGLTEDQWPLKVAV
jgi:hypothetical protein